MTTGYSEENRFQIRSEMQHFRSNEGYASFSPLQSFFLGAPFPSSHPLQICTFLRLRRIFPALQHQLIGLAERPDTSKGTRWGVEEGGQTQYYPHLQSSPICFQNRQGPPRPTADPPVLLCDR